MGHNAILVLVIFVLAVARLTRLINADTITDWLRLWLARRERQHRTIAAGLQPNLDQDELYQHHRRVAGNWATALYFVQCPWCVSMWIALACGFVPVHILGWPWWTVIPVGLATSHLIGVCARFADTEDVDYEDEPAS